MSNPACCALGWFPGSSGDVGMFESAAGYVAQPSTQQAKVGQWNPESAIEK
jgi:hypothetical protein